MIQILTHVAVADVVLVTIIAERLVACLANILAITTVMFATVITLKGNALNLKNRITGLDATTVIAFPMS